MMSMTAAVNMGVSSQIEIDWIGTEGFDDLDGDVVADGLGNRVMLSMPSVA